MSTENKTAKPSFKGTKNYIATDDLQLAVNAAMTLQKPLLIKGEPGTGKTLLAEEVANSLGMPLITWHIKSTTKAEQGLYEYDAVSRLRDSQLGDDKVYEIGNYIKPGKLWEAFTSKERSVLLIDEVDKADIEFPNDLLHELDKMSFYVYETGETITAEQRPVVIITSNNEKSYQMRFCVAVFFIISTFQKSKPCVKLLKYISLISKKNWSTMHSISFINCVTFKDSKNHRQPQSWSIG